MHASLAQLIPIPHRLNELQSICRTELLPTISAAPGFISGTVVTATLSNTAFVVSLWASETERQAAEEHSRNATTTALTPYLLQQPSHEPFEVLVQAGESSGALFARFITLPVPAQHIDAALDVYKGEYLPLLQAQPGFLQVMWLANPGIGTGWGVSFWSSHEQMQAADQEGEFFPKVLARLAVYFSGKPEMAYYAVNQKI
jgi:heme-degrading monooxygenase HmoA